MIKTGITPGGRHAWVESPYGLIRKPIEGKGYLQMYSKSWADLKPETKSINPNLDPKNIEVKGEMWGFPVFGPKRSWWRKILDFLHL